MTDYQEEQENNEKIFYDALRKIDPELYIIKIALNEYPEVPPMVIPKFIKALGNLMIGEGYGNVQTFVQERVVTQIKGQETILVNERSIKKHY